MFSANASITSLSLTPRLDFANNSITRTALSRTFICIPGIGRKPRSYAFRILFFGISCSVSFFPWNSEPRYMRKIRSPKEESVTELLHARKDEFQEHATNENSLRSCEGVASWSLPHCKSFVSHCNSAHTTLRTPCQEVFGADCSSEDPPRANSAVSGKAVRFKKADPLGECCQLSATSTFTPEMTSF